MKEKEYKDIIINICSKDIESDEDIESMFNFIDTDLKDRLIKEYKGIRFAYKFYTYIDAVNENKLFEVRSQILSYASIYESIIHYVLYKYYTDTEAFQQLTNNPKFFKPLSLLTEEEKSKLRPKVNSFGEKFFDKDIVTGVYVNQPIDERSIKFADKCRVAEELGLIHKFTKNGDIQDLPAEIIEIYKYRNYIHITAELKNSIDFEEELRLSQKAYWRLKPFLEQIKTKLKEDNKI